jgi:hypothetical protein
MMTASIVAGEKIAPDFNDLAPEWTLTSAKVMEKDGQKYFRLDGLSDTGIASVTYAGIPVIGVKRIKVTLKYRTDIAKSELHDGAWYCFVFTKKGYSRGNSGFTLPFSEEWSQVENVIEIPEDVIDMSAQLRIQGVFPDSFLEAKDIAIELEE